MNNPVMILNEPDSKGRLKASIVTDRLVWAGIAFQYEQVGADRNGGGGCHTVTVGEVDVPAAVRIMHRAGVSA